MASGPITSWETDGETVETVSDFILGGSKITADGDCSHEIKRCLLLGRKSRDVTLPTKVHLVKAIVSLVVVYGYESWTMKKAECWRIDAFELWSWRRLFNPKGDQSWIFIGRTDVEAETPYFGHLMQRTDSFEKTLMLGKIEGKRRRGWQRMR